VGLWTHYVEFVCPFSGVFNRVRCVGLQTAQAIAEQKRELGFAKVQIIHRRDKHTRGIAAHVHDCRLY